MDIFFQDPSDIPLPPEEVRIRKFHLEPSPDGQRVRVALELTPFQKRPNGEISITDARGREAAGLSIIETMVPSMAFTMHLRGPDLAGPFTAAATIYYIKEPDEPVENPEPGKDPREQVVVDRAEATFDIGKID